MISYDGSFRPSSPIVRDRATTHTDRSQYATATGDRSKHCRSVAPWPNRNQSYDPEIVRSGVTVALCEIFTKLKMVIETLATWNGHNHYFEANKPVCMVAMHYQLPFMISKLCFPITLTIIL